ncbi:Uncharacterised protein [uncultured archaeon]|nr:Uncharacterised protein [uncultured archaeon]
MLKSGKNKISQNRSFSFCAFPKNRRGWIEIVEAVFSIFLIAGVLLIIVNKNSSMNSDISEKVYNIEISILKEIQTNDTIRGDIANAPLPLPLSWTDEGFPNSVKNGISSRIPSYLNCTAKICLLNDSCSLGQSVDTDIYSQSTAIMAVFNQTVYRQLNLFCWQK